MDELSRNLYSSTWWMSVVLFSIFLNIISAYIKDWLDRLLSFLIRRWATRSQQRKKLRELRILFLMSDKDELTAERFWELKQWLWYLSFIVFSLGFILFAEITWKDSPLFILFNVLGVMSLLAATRQFIAATEVHDVIEEARNNSSKRDIHIKEPLT